MNYTGALFLDNFVTIAGIILCMHPANERWSYIVMLSLIGWAHAQKDPNIAMLHNCLTISVVFVVTLYCTTMAYGRKPVYFEIFPRKSIIYV